MKNHLKYLDSLRLIACFLVVGIHTSGMDFETNLMARIIDCACGYAVPIFVTIIETSCRILEGLNRNNFFLYC